MHSSTIIALACGLLALGGAIWLFLWWRRVRRQRAALAAREGVSLRNHPLNARATWLLINWLAALVVCAALLGSAIPDAVVEVRAELRRARLARFAVACGPGVITVRNNGDEPRWVLIERVVRRRGLLAPSRRATEAALQDGRARRVAPGGQASFRLAGREPGAIRLRLASTLHRPTYLQVKLVIAESLDQPAEAEGSFSCREPR